MPASKKIALHLGKKNVKFDVVSHKKVYTAYDLAQTLGTELDRIAKSLLVKAEFPVVQKKSGNYFVVVVPASYYVDLRKVKKALKAARVALAPEKIMKKLGLEPGALSPFGSLRGFGVVVDKAMLQVKDAIVGAESFTESLRMKMKDLVAVEAPIVAVVGKKNKMKLQKRAAAKRKTAKRKTAGKRKKRT